MKASQENRRRMADEHYEDIGRSVAALASDTNLGARKAWAMLGGVGLYQYWMLEHWVNRYEEEKEPARRPRRKPREGAFRRKELLDQLKSNRGLDSPPIMGS